MGPTLVAINHFVSDSDAEIAALKAYVEDQGSEAIICKHWAQGSEGTEALARRVVSVIEAGDADFSPLYPDEMPLMAKIETIARKIYGADSVQADSKILRQLEAWESEGHGHLPVCMAKTQCSFSADPTLLGAPDGHELPIREVRLAAGARFIVVICGAIMTMPGLPRHPAAEVIGLDESGQVTGLFR